MTIGVLLAWSLVTGIVSATIFADAHALTLLRLFLIMGVFWLIVSNDYLFLGSVVALVVGLVFFVAGFAGFFTQPDEPNFADRAIHFIREIVQFLQGNIRHRDDLEHAIVWILQILIGLFVVLFGGLYAQFFVLFLVSAGIFSLVLTAPAFTHHLAFYVFLFCVLAFLMRHLSQKTAQAAGIGTSFPIYATLFAALCMLIASLLPMPFEATDVQAALRRPFSALNNAIYSASRPDYFSVRHVGFGDEGGRLGGDIAPDDGLFLLLRTESPTPIYLRGTVMDTYTGYSWENRLGGERVPFEPDWTMHNLDFLERAISSPLGFELRSMDINITSSTHSVFSTDFVQDIFALNIEANFLRDQHGQLYSEARMPRNTWYTVVYAAPVNAFRDITFLQNSRRGMLQEWRGTVFPENDDLLNNYLIPRAAWIHETYTALPADFPARVGELATAVTAGAGSDYERARLLERHLAATHFYYTLTPGMPPADQDFVDYFLFDSQEGYCVYFASAFVTMARAIGLPARYVEGFLVSGESNEDGLFEVRNNMGHAWAEVYLEGYGWHIFEPTPAGGLPGPSMPAIPGLPSGPDPDSSVEGSDPGYTPALHETPPADDETLPVSGEVRPPADAEEEEPAELISDGRIWPIAVLIPLFLFIVLGARILWVSLRLAQAERQRHGEAVIYYFEAILRYMRYFGVTIRETETAAQFMMRAGEACPFLASPLQIAAVYAKARYSPHTIGVKERVLMEVAVYQLDAKLRETLGRGRYLFYKYILAIV